MTPPTKAQRLARKRRLNRYGRMAMGEAPKSVKHGKDSTYVNWGCRCTRCTQAHAEAAAERRSR